MFADSLYVTFYSLEVKEKVLARLKEVMDFSNLDESHPLFR